VHQGLFKSHEPWLDKDGQTVVPEEYFNLGGKTKWYGAALLRFSADEFEADERHQCRAWPIAYRDLEPYYQQAEQLFEVHHFAVEPNLRRIVDRLQRNGGGWHVEPLPLGLMPDIVNHPEEAGHYDGFASIKDLKADAQRCLLEQSRSLANFEIVTGATVEQLIADESGPRRIQGVVDQRGHRYLADKIILAAGALHSPRLLQDYLETTGLSRNLPCYPMVGRHYKCHLLTALLAVSFSPKTDVLRKTALLLNDNCPHSSVQPLGFGTDVISTLFPGFVPRWLGKLIGTRAYGFFLQTEDGSDENNRVLAKANGVQKPQLDYDPKRLPAALREHRRLVRVLSRSLLRAGFIPLSQPIPLTGTAHACGTLVTGTDPNTSVVDANSKVHGMENLYVVDGSILPRSGRENPSLTIYAWALRVADRLAYTGESR
jgi:choline dehydrogenase-like flavoprotein